MPETALASEQLLLNPGAQLRVVEAPDGDPPGAPEPARRPQPRLEIPGYDLGAAVALERELGIGHVLAQILVRRGLRDPVVAREFLEARQRHPPSAFSGIERAVEVIAPAAPHACGYPRSPFQSCKSPRNTRLLATSTT